MLCFLIITSAIRYLIDIDQFKQYFISFGYNKRIVLPLAFAKLLAAVAILGNISHVLKEWAYAALFFNFLLALEAHLALDDDLFYGPIVALILLILSYLFYRKSFSYHYHKFRF